MKIRANFSVGVVHSEILVRDAVGMINLLDQLPEANRSQVRSAVCQAAVLTVIVVNLPALYRRRSSKETNKRVVLVSTSSGNRVLEHK